MMLLSIIRKLFRIGPPAITRAHALQLARQACRQRGWEWEEPVLVREGLKTWRVWTNADCAGGNVSIVIDARSGAILLIGRIER